MKVISLALLLVAACASEQIDLPGVVPEGPRLIPQYVVAEGGARQLLHLVDRQTGEPCDFRVASDLGAPGVCVPAASGWIVFLDDACQRPMVQAYANNHAWVAIMRGPGADWLDKLVRLGAPASDVTNLHQLGAGGCEVAVQSGVPVFAIVEELPRDALAKGAIEARDLGPALSASAFVGDDGSSFISALSDRTGESSCRPGMTEAGARCVPQLGSIAHGGIYDERCERIAYDNFIGNPVAIVTDLGGATYRFGPRFSGATITLGRRGPSGECVTEEREIPPFGALHFGVPYPESAWPALELTTEGGPRMTARVATLPDGNAYFERPATFDDRGAPCGPAWVDGVLRCLPLPVYPSYSVYSDPACTDQITVFGAAGAPPSVTVLDGPPGGPAQGNLPTGRVRAIGRELERAFVVTRSAGGCSPATPEDRYFAFGDDVDPAQFAALTLVSD